MDNYKHKYTSKNKGTFIPLNFGKKKATQETLEDKKFLVLYVRGNLALVLMFEYFDNLN